MLEKEPKFKVGDEIFISQKHVKGRVNEIISGVGGLHYNYQCEYKHINGIKVIETFPEQMISSWKEAAEFVENKKVFINQSPKTLINQAIKSRIASIPANEVLGGIKVTGGYLEMEKALEDRTKKLTTNILKERQIKTFSNASDFTQRMSNRVGNFDWNKLEDAFDYSNADFQSPKEDIEEEISLKVVPGGKQSFQEIAIIKAKEAAQNPENIGN